jgi:hypothetical protein
MMSMRMKEARRAPGSEWLKDHPWLLEIAYFVSRRLILATYPLLKRLRPRLAERALTRGEEQIKGYAFNCQMCGQCILHSTGMTCPMTCPKNLRNGPCGGVRPDGRCEVIPEMPCVWVQAWERSRQMLIYADQIQTVQPPLNRALQGTSAWANLAEGRDARTPPGWSLAVSTRTSMKLKKGTKSTNSNNPS